MVITDYLSDSLPGAFRHIFSRIVVAGLLLFTAAWAQAGEADIDAMLKTIEQRLADVSTRQQAIEDGQDRALLCKYCHGSDGNSLKPEVPNLAGQNAKYLLEQINKFATKEREDFVMSELAAGFSTEDKINVAIFYSSQVVKPTAVDKDQAAMGQALYHSACSSCHGMKGLGNEEMARLAGQKSVYTANVMKSFRKNARDSAAMAESTRHSKVMEAVASKLTDEQIESVAVYIAQMQ